MPQYTSNGIRYDYCTEKELLVFANKVRQAGGADFLLALLPSSPGSAERCLVANALNFGCSVALTSRTFADGCRQWEMIVSRDIDVPALAKKIRCKPNFERSSSIILPRKVGNTARAFDNGRGWTVKYNRFRNAEY